MLVSHSLFSLYRTSPRLAVHSARGPKPDIWSPISKASKFLVAPAPTLAQTSPTGQLLESRPSVPTSEEKSHLKKLDLSKDAIHSYMKEP